MNSETSLAPTCAAIRNQLATEIPSMIEAMLPSVLADMSAEIDSAMSAWTSEQAAMMVSEMTEDPAMATMIGKAIHASLQNAAVKAAQSKEKAK